MNSSTRLWPGVRFALATLTIALAPACSSSSGGEKQPTAQQQQGASTATATGADANAASPKSATTEPGGTPASGGNQPAATGGQATTGAQASGSHQDPTDQAICQYLNTVSDATAHAASGVAYLCQQNGLAALRQANGNAKMVSQTQDSQNNTVFLVGDAMKSSGTLQQAVKLSNVFCSSFQQYEQLVGSAAFTQVKSITPSNASGGNCDFDFEGQPILGGLIGQPAYKGHEESSTSQDGTIAVSIQFMVQSESPLVVDASSLSITVQSGGGLFAYVLGYSVANTHGFASMAGQQLEQATTAGLQGASKAIASGGF